MAFLRSRTKKALFGVKRGFLYTRIYVYKERAHTREAVCLEAEDLECLPFIVLDILLLLNGFGERDIDDFAILESDHD